MQPRRHRCAFTLRHWLDSRGEPSWRRQISLWESRRLCESRDSFGDAHAGAQTAAWGASVVMKQDINSTNTHTHNHCRWKSGYPSYLYIEKGFKCLSSFRKKDTRKRTPRKTGQLLLDGAPVIRFIHRLPSALLRRPLPIVGIAIKRNKISKLLCTRFSHAANLAEENRLQTAWGHESAQPRNRGPEKKSTAALADKKYPDRSKKILSALCGEERVSISNCRNSKRSHP